MSERGVAAVLLGLLAGMVSLSVVAAEVREDRGHVYTWNRYADDLRVLHEQQLQGREIRRETAVGGYAGKPNFYEEVKYYDVASGRLLSVVQRELENPRNIHSITVNRYDEQGRLARDYSATYLPHARNAPVQTLVFLHTYNDGVHAFRSFDASDDMLYQRCEGTYQGEPVFISMDIDEIEAAAAELYQYKRGIMSEPVYTYCFSRLPETAAGALPPR